MASRAPRGNPATLLHRLVAHERPEAIVAWRGSEAVTAGQFLADVTAAAATLPESGHVLNFCADRYRFAVLLLAAMVRKQLTLLPPATTPNVIRAMKDFAPDAYYVSDDPAFEIALPRHELPHSGACVADTFAVPEAPADQAIAIAFTSGSTGEPQPNTKHWGNLVVDVLAEARRLAIGPGHAILGTVPPQHMYGFESTVLLPLLTGAALTGERLFYPGDIDAAIGRVPAPRTIFTTPYHLRAWMESGEPARVESIVCATAPLSPALARRAEERTRACLIEIYGCTEAGQVATRRPTQSAQWEAFDGLRLWCEGEQAMVAGGHVERPTPLGDIIEVQGDGTRFLLHGRTEDMVNVAGRRNSIGYLNHQLTSIDGVDDAAFFLPDAAVGDGVTRLMAFAVAPGLEAAAILASLRQRIDPAFLPRPLVLVERLPRQLTGKLTRESLQALARAHGNANPRRA